MVLAYKLGKMRFFTFVFMKLVKIQVFGFRQVQSRYFCQEYWISPAENVESFQEFYFLYLEDLSFEIGYFVI